MFDELVDLANKDYDGHFTILKFTTNYRVCLGTLHEINPLITLYMAKGKTLDEAIKNAIDNKIDCYKVDELFKENCL
ncbi:hypothetical protein [Clostridium neonatale]|uniref:Uncharacterized protein n=1 Tax=Clostridium neonatale TaxID=137838 RepID=A0AAD2DFZ0_9CLOT|nr:hypothetical protein [Clostridium neonatale]MBP8312802.1 hypothetical protein [Clostridium neonatale]CAI3195301.1 hypothetical protein CNEO2_1300018 [Clostridium neonatale]CAI3214049.1 hypothetical protein CNEO2_960007 [Clostridium neonatale]CAI3216190.1 hypothetical protein CNEO2_960018 [Clostridium neonatale]CAI3216725.1 hypothetical protein CNEO2_1030018 [Clostridium neonatale]